MHRDSRSIVPKNFQPCGPWIQAIAASAETFLFVDAGFFAARGNASPSTVQAVAAVASLFAYVATFCVCCDVLREKNYIRQL